MKAHIRKQPNLVTVLELNQRFGHGYQARMIMEGVLESVIDSEPFTLEEITSGAASAIEEINRQTGYTYKPHEVIRIPNEAVQANKGHDSASARVARDIDRGRGELTHPDGADCTTETVDGKEEVLLSGRGTILTCYFAWLEDKKPKAREALLRYCQYLALHGYGGGQLDIFAELGRMDEDRGTNWIKATYGKYVTDDRDAINYVLNGN